MADEVLYVVEANCGTGEQARRPMTEEERARHAEDVAAYELVRQRIRDAEEAAVTAKQEQEAAREEIRAAVRNDPNKPLSASVVAKAFGLR